MALDEFIRCLGTESHCFCSLVPITSLHSFEQIFLKLGALKEHLKSQGHQGSGSPKDSSGETPGWKMLLACGCLISVSVFVHSSSPVRLSQTVCLGRHLSWMGFATHCDRTRLCLSKSLTWLHFKKFFIRVKVTFVGDMPFRGPGHVLIGVIIQPAANSIGFFLIP